MLYTNNYRVYYEDTDAAGVVYHSNYLKFAERSRTEMLRGLGLNQSNLMTENGVYFVVHNLEMTIHRPAILDDMLSITSRIGSIRGAIINFDQKITINDKKICSLKVKIASLNKMKKPIRVPPNIISLLSN